MSRECGRGAGVTDSDSIGENGPFILGKGQGSPNRRLLITFRDKL